MNHQTQTSSRRDFLLTASAAALAASPLAKISATETQWQPRYMLASSMYGKLDLSVILPEVKKIGATAIDLWPKVHGNQREQLDELGEEKFAAMLKSHGITLGCITQYPLGPFRLQEEMRLSQRLGNSMIVTGAKGPRGLKGKEEKAAVKKFVEQMQPHLEVAEETGVTIAIENHANSLIESPDSLKWLAEFSPNKHLAIAFAPYHLPQDENLLAGLLRNMHEKIGIFYAWQHGMGCHKKLPKEQELLQMPGRGDLDFGPLWNMLADVNYSGWIEIFMHPVPRGIPILPTAEEVTEEINTSRAYLASLNT